MTLNLRAAWLLFFLFFMQASIADSHQQLPLSYAPLNSAFEPQQAARLEFHRYISGFRLPFAQNPHGIVLRMEMPALAESPGDYNLVLHPQYLAEATLWLKQQGDPRWISEKRGRLLPGKPSYYSPQTLVYELPKKLDDSSFLYLVVRDRGVPKPVSINLVNRKTFLESDVSISRYTLVLYAVVVVLAVVNLVFFAYIRELPFLYYSIYMLLAVLALIWQDGWIGEMLYLPDTVIVNRWLHFFSMLPAVFFYQFYRSFLGLDRKTLGGKLMLGFQFGFVIILVLSQADSYWSDTYMRNLWVMLFNGLLALGALAIFVLTLRYWIMGVKTAGYLFIANLLLIVATLVRIYYAFTFSLENAY